MATKKKAASGNKPAAKARAKKPDAKKAEAKAAGKNAAPRKPALVQDKFKAPNHDQIITAVRRIEGHAKVAAEKNGEVGELIAKLCETQHFNRKSLSVARSFHAMSDNKLAEAWPHLLLYGEALGFEKRCSAQGKLALEPGGKKGEEKGDMDGTDDDADKVPAPSLQRMPSDDEKEPAFH